MFLCFLNFLHLKRKINIFFNFFFNFLKLFSFLIYDISLNQICISFQCTISRFVWKVLSGGITCISSNFAHQAALHELVANVATRWHYLQNKFVHQVFWPPGGATCIATLLRIALLTSPVGIELLSSSARVTSVKSVKGHYESSCRS